MDAKPVVTYSGDRELFRNLEENLTQGLPQQPSEWRRSYGRAVKSVHVEASFIPFDESCLPKSGFTCLLGQATFHTYWIECCDVEAYKTNARDGIQAWLKVLKQNNVVDWMIVVVEAPDSKKGTKLLPRTTVLDKIRSDFASKQGERCISLLDPTKADTRSTESWQILMHRFRQLLLSSYNRLLGRFEENVRLQRERRNEPSWNFCDYFLLQEELAFVFEVLGLYDEALIQYDELDALFTQFVLNSVVGDVPAWLSSFQKPFEHWTGLVFNSKINQGLRELIQTSKASLFEFRNYLFSRQCAMLLLLYRPWEIAQRALPFLHNCLNEIRILEIAAPPGAVSCWVFLSCLEVLQSCDRFGDSSQIEAYSLYTAGLWAYACQKLRELGKLCGLMPREKTTSEQLHVVVNLSAGIDDSQQNSSPDQLTPVDRLKEALSSKEAFKKHYLELSELAMGTFKHVSRLRMAKQIGQDLAVFYSELGELQKVSAFLSDSLQVYNTEKWCHLACQTELQLAKCCLDMKEYQQYTKLCARIASSKLLLDSVRQEYLCKMMSTLKENLKDEKVVIPLEDVFDILSVRAVTQGKVIVDTCEVEVHVELHSRLGEPLTFTDASVSIELCGQTSRKEKHDAGDRQQSVRKRTPSITHRQKIDKLNDSKNNMPQWDTRLKMTEESEYQQDKTLSIVKVVCKNTHQILRRRDSSHGGYHPEKPPKKSDAAIACSAASVVIVPGHNAIVTKTKVKENGTYKLLQLILQMDQLELISQPISPTVSFHVLVENPTFAVVRQDNEMLAGIEQSLMLEMRTGSKRIEEGMTIFMESSRGLQLQKKHVDEPFNNEVQLLLPQTEPFQLSVLPLRVETVLPPQKDASMMEHKITIQSLWNKSECHIPLFFIPPFMSSHKLHTANTRKFIQVSVSGLCKQKFQLCDEKLAVLGLNDIVLKPCNKSGSDHVVASNVSASYMWEIVVDSDLDGYPLRMEFQVQYRLSQAGNTSSWRTYKYVMEIYDYKTLFTIKSRVEPPKGSEFCRAKAMCNMHIQICQTNPSSYTSLVYEVRVDQTVWSVCRQTAGIVSLEDTSKTQSIVLEVKPLIGGFLPLPSVCLSKYIAAEQKDPNRKPEVGKNASSTVSRLQPFSPGQVYNWSKGQRVHVLPATQSSGDGRGSTGDSQN